VFDDGNDFIVGQSGIKKNRSSSFGKIFFAVQAIQQSAALIFAVEGTHADIFTAPNAVERTLFIMAKKLLEIVHDQVEQ
jgi:hypothetical protein